MVPDTMALPIYDFSKMISLSTYFVKEAYAHLCDEIRDSICVAT